MLSHLSRSLVLLALLFVTACDEPESGPQARPAPPPPEVLVETVALHDVPLTFEYAGRVAGFREVEVRSRVSGILLERSYEEGAVVEKGDLLFRIDPAPFEAALAAAKAQLQRAEAALRENQRNFDRRAALVKRGTVSEASLDEARAARDTAAADVAVAKANMRTAELNLGYTSVHAPVGGTTSLDAVPEGSLIGTSPENSLLTTITQLEPVYVHFAIPDSEALSVRQLQESGKLSMPVEGSAPVEIRSGSGNDLLATGTLDFTSSTIDPVTGTLRARALVPNTDNALLPGQFVRVVVKSVTLRNVVTIAQKALLQNQTGQMVYVVDGQGQAQIRLVTVGQAVGDEWVIEEGLEPGDRVVVEGLLKVQPGGPVRVAEAEQPSVAENSASRP